MGGVVLHRNSESSAAAKSSSGMWAARWVSRLCLCRCCFGGTLFVNRVFALGEYEVTIESVVEVGGFCRAHLRNCAVSFSGVGSHKGFEDFVFI